MSFICECGFRAELSATQRERLAGSGGRVKCPKCGKSSTLPVELPSAQNAASSLPIERPAEPDTTLDQLLGIDSASSSERVAIASAVLKTQQTSESDSVVDSVRPPSRQSSPNSRRWAFAGTIVLLVVLFMIALGRGGNQQPTDALAKLEARIEQLEKRNEQLQDELAKVGANPIVKTKEQTEAMLKDALAGATLNVAGLQILDKNGRIRISLGIAEQKLVDTKGKPWENVEAEFSMRSDEGTKLLRMSADTHAEIVVTDALSVGFPAELKEKFPTTTTVIKCDGLMIAKDRRWWSPVLTR